MCLHVLCVVEGMLVPAHARGGLLLSRCLRSALCRRACSWQQCVVCDAWLVRPRPLACSLQCPTPLPAQLRLFAPSYASQALRPLPFCASVRIHAGLSSAVTEYGHRSLKTISNLSRAPLRPLDWIVFVSAIFRAYVLWFFFCGILELMHEACKC